MLDYAELCFNKIYNVDLITIIVWLYKSSTIHSEPIMLPGATFIVKSKYDSY